MIRTIGKGNKKNDMMILPIKGIEQGVKFDQMINSVGRQIGQATIIRPITITDKTKRIPRREKYVEIEKHRHKRSARDTSCMLPGPAVIITRKSIVQCPRTHACEILDRTTLI